ncbi:MAG: peptidoglycan-binding protein [Patescibacteria group bacterium]|nr:peptidoglycan-binding protein [Patescibacteria group bacterium]
MQKVTTKAIAKVAAVATGLAMATSMFSLAPMAHAAALTSSQIQSILSLLSSFGADASTIANVQASLTGGTPSTTTTSASACSFTKDLTVGSKGAEVTCLQNALKAGGYMSANATGYFGALTKAGVIAWQKAKGVSPAAGYFGAKSRAAFGGMAATTAGTTTTTTTTTTPAAPITGNGLKVALSATSPSGTVLVAGQAIGDLGDYTFSNPTASPINVTALTFNRTGVSNDTTLTNIYLYSGGTRLTDSVGISNSQFVFNNGASLFTVPAGGTYTVSVRSDIAASTSGQQIGVSLVSATSSGTLDSSVVFPIASGLQTVSAATLAGVNYGATVTPSAATTISAQNDYPLWQNTVSVSSNPVKLTSLRFTNLGSTNAGDVVNLRLYVDGTMVGSAVPQMGSDRTVTFDFSAAPILLSTSSHVIKVVGNVLSSGAQKTITLSVQRASDGMFVDSQLGQPVTPTSNSSSFSAESAQAITVQYASNAGVSVSLAPSSPSSNVAVGASNVKWASFQMLASGENVKVTDLTLYAADSVSTTGGLANGKVMVNGVQVGSTKSIGYNSSNTTDFSLGSSLILPGGQTTTVDIYADAKTSTSTNLQANETVTVTLVTGSSNGQGQSSLTSTNVPASSVNGNTITVSSSSLTATKYSGYGNQTMIVGTNNAKLGAFTLSTGSTEGVTVNTIYITFPNAVTSTITNLTLKDDATGTMYGTVQTTPSTSNSFSGTVDIPVSSTKTFDIYGNIVSGANTGTIVPSVGVSTSGTGDITGTSASPAATALQTITLGTGTLTVTNGPADPVSNNVVAGASAVSVGEFNFAATNSSYTVQNLAILVPNGQATSVTNVTVSYKDVNGNPQTATQALNVSSTLAYSTATFTGLSMYVPSNDSSNLDVSVGVPTLASNGASGTGINIALDRGGQNGGNSTFRAINSAGSATTTPSAQSSALSAGGTFYVRKSVPTFAMLAAPSTQPSSGSALYRFSITADPAGAVEWTRLNFTIATSATTAAGPMLSSMYITNEASGVSLLDSNSTSATTTKNNVTVDLSQNSVQPKFEQIGAGSTKIYDLYGTVSNWTTGSSLTINLASDGSATTTSAAATVDTSNVVWSDRSASSHSISTADWTNGYLLKNFTTNATSYSK